MLKKIQEFVAQHYGVSVEDMLSSSRGAKVAEARKVAMFVSRKYTTKSLPAIAAAFNKTHAVVINSVKAIDKRIVSDEALKGDVEGICGRIMANE